MLTGLTLDAAGLMVIVEVESLRSLILSSGRAEMKELPRHAASKH